MISWRPGDCHPSTTVATSRPVTSSTISLTFAAAGNVNDNRRRPTAGFGVGGSSASCTAASIPAASTPAWISKEASLWSVRVLPLVSRATART